MRASRTACARARILARCWSVASGQVRSLTGAWAPFEIELTDIGIFPATDVIYIQVGAGAAELNRMEKLRDPSHVRAMPRAELMDLFRSVGLPEPRIRGNLP